MAASPTTPLGAPTTTTMARLTGTHRTVLITGVSRGLGRALALELAKRGHTVLGCSRSQDKLNSLQADLAAVSSSNPSSPASAVQNKHLVMNVDVLIGLLTGKSGLLVITRILLKTDNENFVECLISEDEGGARSDSSVQDLARTVVEKKSVPDIIVNNAGTINRNNKIWDVPVEEFDTVIDTNIKGIANMLRHFVPLMIERKQGVIVNMSSGWGRSAAAQVAPYCASKWAVEGLTRSAAKELPAGVAIVSLSPGVINTDMLQSCFGSSASFYQTPEAWAPRAATMILNLSVADNGASLTV